VGANLSTLSVVMTDDEFRFAANLAEERGEVAGVASLVQNVWFAWLQDQGYVDPSIINPGPEYEVIDTCPWCKRKVVPSKSTITEDFPQTQDGVEKIIRILWHGKCLKNAEKRLNEDLDDGQDDPRYGGY
jgi:hypothetical protein